MVDTGLFHLSMFDRSERVLLSAITYYIVAMNTFTFLPMCENKSTRWGATKEKREICESFNKLLVGCFVFAGGNLRYRIEFD